MTAPRTVLVRWGTSIKGFIMMSQSSNKISSTAVISNRSELSLTKNRSFHSQNRSNVVKLNSDRLLSDLRGDTRFGAAHGYVTDSGSGMQMLGARYYLPALGRFLTHGFRNTVRQRSNGNGNRRAIAFNDLLLLALFIKVWSLFWRVERRCMTLTSAFARLPDPRLARRRYPPGDLLFIALCAVLSGADNTRQSPCGRLLCFVEIEDWANRAKLVLSDAKQEWLKERLDLSHGVPSHERLLKVARLRC